jgi:hypothetical protein
VVLKIQALLFLRIVWQDILALSIGVIAAAIFVLILVDGRGYGTRVGAARIRAVCRILFRAKLGAIVGLYVSNRSVYMLSREQLVGHVGDCYAGDAAHGEASQRKPHLRLSAAGWARLHLQCCRPS